MLLKDALEHAEHTPDLVVVPVDRALDLLGVVPREPDGLAVVRALARCLEVEPLQLAVVLVGTWCDRDLVLLVVLVDDVLGDCVRLPMCTSVSKRGKTVRVMSGRTR